MNSPPKSPGRPKGSPNKSTAKCREVIGLIADEMAEDFKAWLLLTAAGDEERGMKPDPKGAAELYLKSIEYHVPKLSRIEGHMSVEQQSHEDWLGQLG